MTVRAVICSSTPRTTDCKHVSKTETVQRISALKQRLELVGINTENNAENNFRCLKSNRKRSNRSWGHTENKHVTADKRSQTLTPLYSSCWWKVEFARDTHFKIATVNKNMNLMMSLNQRSCNYHLWPQWSLFSHIFSFKTNVLKGKLIGFVL